MAYFLLDNLSTLHRAKCVKNGSVYNSKRVTGYKIFSAFCPQSDVRLTLNQNRVRLRLYT